jgi:CO dehydrogenase/acetyl-CoA synthase gamma subunit (corrinoid Fe-S protein)
MAVGKNAMKIFSILDKSNCKKCGEKTCLAFALVAERIGARLNGNELTVPVLGKKFGIRLDGFVCNRSSYHSLGSVYRT